MTPRLSVLIKAFNEERRIEACLAAAVAEAAPLGGEVILVDSCSADRTVELARRFPVRIVQFASPADRGCAAAVQLGYQFAAASDYVYVLDADMVLQPGFLAKAMAVLQADPKLAGVGGKLMDVRIQSQSDLRRRRAYDRQTDDTDVPELGGGGLYRQAAVRQVGYLAHRGLAAFEEAELGARLRAAGWRLRRLASPAVLHEGHAEGNWQMLRRLWRNGRAQATGALLRSAWGRPWFWALARKQAFIAVPPACWGLVALLALAGGAGRPAAWLAAALAVHGGLILLLAVRRRNLGSALWTWLFWHYFALAACAGFARPVPSPLTPVAAHELPHQSMSPGRPAEEPAC